MNSWIIFVLCFAAGVVAQSNEFDYYNDYDDNWYQDELEKLGIVDTGSDETAELNKDIVDIKNIVSKPGSVGSEELNEDEIDKKVEEEIQKFQEINDQDDEPKPKIEDKDYQIEDNRSDQQKAQAESEDVSQVADDVDGSDEVPDIENKEDFVLLQQKDYDDYAQNVKDVEKLLEYANSNEDENEDEDNQVAVDNDTAPLPVPPSSDEMKNILEETQAILNEELKNSNDFDDETNEDFKEDKEKSVEAIVEEPTDNSQETDKKSDDENVEKNDSEFENDSLKSIEAVMEENNLNDILDETKNILEESESQFDDDSDSIQDADDDFIEQINMQNILEETKNILEDGDNQFDDDIDSKENINGEGNEAENESDDASDNDSDLGDILEGLDDDTMEKVYGDLNQDLAKLFETIDKLSSSPEDDLEDQVPKDGDVDYAANSDESLDEKPDYEVVFDSNLSEILSNGVKKESDIEKQPAQEDFENNSDDTDENNKNDGNSSEDNKNVDDDNVNIDQEQNDESKPYIDDELVSDVANSIPVDEMTSEQLEEAQDNFVENNVDKMDIAQQTSDNHEVREIRLEYGETLVIESDNYPRPYPTNRMIDWVVTANGIGIEFNVTDFAVNSIVGDYLLVKPGQTDESGDDGMLFSYRLNSPRMYRFLQADSLFIRFNAARGMSFLTGFSLSLNVISPNLELEEEVPEAESLVPTPHSELTVFLGGPSHEEFTSVEEDFRLIIADMASMYINANDIDPGLNTTSEVAQITKTFVCNIHWPNYERCTAVRFSVPLAYEEEDEEDQRLSEEDLKAMWFGYLNQDPFATRLRALGITEFATPDDSSILMMWLLIAIAVVAVAAMLALALWRYSCGDNYSRMPEFSDTDSIDEKRRMDLYPTPHQTLPPLYSESEYKWGKEDDTSRVDMGGFSNRSYVRNDIYDDSDEEVVPRDRYTSDV